MTKETRVVIEDAWRLKGRRAPSSLGPYISIDEWTNLTYDIYDAISPAIRFKQLQVWGLAGLFAIPLLSFFFLFALVYTDILVIEKDDDGEFGEEDEEAFQLLLIATASGCLGLSVLCLLLGSAIRRNYYQKLVEAQLKDVIEKFTRNRAKRRDGVEFQIKISQPKRSGCQESCRLAFMAWGDLDFDFRATVKDNFDDYSSMVSQQSTFTGTLTL